VNYDRNITEELAVLGQLAPQALSIGAHVVGPFRLPSMNKLFAIINVGTIGPASTIDAQFKAAPTQSGSYVPVVGTQITQISSGLTNLVLVELRAETAGGQGVGPWFELVVTIGVAPSQVSGEVFGTSGYYPSSDYNAVTPTQVLVA
jgi:hypothetical protein